MTLLPKHLAIGRSSFGGPVLGGYICIPFGPLDAADNLTDSVLVACALPFGFRIEAVTWSVLAATDATIMIHSNDDATVDGTETDLLSAAIDIEASATGVARPTGTTPTIITGAGASDKRNLDRGEYIVLSTTTTLTTGAIDELQVWVWGFTMDHTNSGSADD
jgi:hypothetical protein